MKIFYKRPYLCIPHDYWERIKDGGYDGQKIVDETNCFLSEFKVSQTELPLIFDHYLGVEFEHYLLAENVKNRREIFNYISEFQTSTRLHLPYTMITKKAGSGTADNIISVQISNKDFGANLPVFTFLILKDNEKRPEDGGLSVFKPKVYDDYFWFYIRERCKRITDFFAPVVEREKARSSLENKKSYDNVFKENKDFYSVCEKVISQDKHSIDEFYSEYKRGKRVDLSARGPIAPTEECIENLNTTLKAVQNYFGAQRHIASIEEERKCH